MVGGGHEHGRLHPQPNRVTHSSGATQTPMEAMTGHRPDLSELRVFGCLAYRLVNDPARRDKLAPKATRCIFLGYSEANSAYRLYDIDESRVTTAVHVRFLETEFFSDGHAPNDDDDNSDSDDENNGMPTQHRSPSPTTTTTATSPSPVATPAQRLDDGPHAIADLVTPEHLLTPPERVYRDALTDRYAAASRTSRSTGHAEPSPYFRDRTLPDTSRYNSHMVTRLMSRAASAPAAATLRSHFKAPAAATSAPTLVSTIASSRPMRHAGKPVRYRNGADSSSLVVEGGPDTDGSASGCNDNYEIVMLAAAPGVPTSHKEAMASPEREQWLKAEATELQQLEDMKTWSYEPLPHGRKAIGVRWTYAKKTSSATRPASSAKALPKSTASTTTQRRPP